VSRAKRKPRKLVTYEIESRVADGRWTIKAFGTDELNAIELFKRMVIENNRLDNPRQMELVKRTMLINDEVLLSNE
jgi:hypothetical protein